MRVIKGLLAFLLVFLTFALPAGAAEFVEGEVLVLLRNGTGETLRYGMLAEGAGKSYVQAAAAKAGAEHVHTYSALSKSSGQILALVRSQNKTTKELIEALEADPDVVSVSPNHIVYAKLQPNDPMFGSLWGMNKIRAPEAWESSTGSEQVRVAVIDSGAYSGHPDLAANLDSSLSANFTNPNWNSTPSFNSSYQDDNGHGTHVSGTIGAVGNNAVGVTGVNWKTKIVVLRALQEIGNGTASGYDSWIIAALDYLTWLQDSSHEPSNDYGTRPASSVRVYAVNLSLGGWAEDTPQQVMNKNTAEWAAYKALDALNRTVIVVAAGNEGMEVGAPAPRDVRNNQGEVVIAKGSYVYPASFIGIDNLIVVGATTETDGAASFTNWSQTYVDLGVPGTEILSTVPSFYSATGYAEMQGTSMAAPHVTGAVGLLASAGPDLTAAQLKALLLENADSSINPVLANSFNSSGQKVSRKGMLDLKAAMDAVGSVAPSGMIESFAVSPASPSVGTECTATATFLRPASSALMTMTLPDGTAQSLTVALDSASTSAWANFVPAASGRYTLKVQAVDASEEAFEKETSVTVTAAGGEIVEDVDMGTTLPSVGKSSTITVRFGRSVSSAQMQMTLPDESVRSLPVSLVASNTVATANFTPQSGGSHLLTIRATDSSGGTYRDTYSFTVESRKFSSSSGGGCNAGTAALLLLALPVFLRKR